MSDIDLGVSAKDKYDMGGMQLSQGSKEKVYPCFHYCGPLELDLPDEGEMIITFRKKKETSEIEEDGSHWYSCDIEVRQIKSVDGEEASESVEAPAHSRDEAGDALDRIREILEKGGNDNDSEGY